MYNVEQRFKYLIGYYMNDFKKCDEFCFICGYEAKGKQLTNHIRKEHGLTSIEYVIKHLYNENRPVCAYIDCNNETRYSAFKFKKYCQNHSKIAESEGGKVGGSKSEPWNKGLTKHEDDRLKIVSDKSKGSNNPFYGKRHSKSTRKKISDTKRIAKKELLERIDHRSTEFRLITSPEDYKSRQHQYLNFKCVVCDKENNKTLQSFERGSLCLGCHPFGVSQQQLEISNWLNSLNISHELNNRLVLNGKEIDITFPQLKFGIEFNGLYWHSELSLREIDKRYHLEKTNSCTEAGWDLLHVFSDEWSNKREIVESMILHRLQRSKHRMYARKCEFRTINKDERTIFFNDNHLSGDVRSSHSFGLYHDNKLISAISFRKPLQKKWNDSLEIARFANAKYASIPGSFGKLMTNAIAHMSKAKVKINKVLSYSDNRIGNGSCYQKYGFKCLGNTSPDYWYTDGIHRYGRFVFRAKDGLSEKEIAKKNGVGRIYGCGSRIWLLEL
jgi:hypothetical protein